MTYAVIRYCVCYLFCLGGALLAWFVVLGAFLVFFTPKNIKQYAFNERHFSEVELAISSGFHFGSLIYGVGLIASVCFPLLEESEGWQIFGVCADEGLFMCVCLYNGNVASDVNSHYFNDYMAIHLLIIKGSWT